MGWYANTWLRAYDVTGDVKYLNEAKAIFSDMTKVWDATCGGGIWWTSDRDYKNAITNELFLLAAARLARRTPAGTMEGDFSYKDWALKEADWFVNKSGMINGKNLVNDGLTKDGNCKNNGQAEWSYNQGVILGGLTEMWRLTGDRGYLASAEKIADAVLKNMVHPNGALRDVCDQWGGGCTGDAVIFKAMFAQGLARLYNADRANKPQYGAFLVASANSLWDKSRTPENGFGINWNGPAVDTYAADEDVAKAKQSAAGSGALLLSEVALLNAGGEVTPPTR
jgi:predicted alpha-1,6-mannanase (GH76 family)